MLCLLRDKDHLDTQFQREPGYLSVLGTQAYNKNPENSVATNMRALVTHTPIYMQLQCFQVSGMANEEGSDSSQLRDYNGKPF